MSKIQGQVIILDEKFGLCSSPIINYEHLIIEERFYTSGIFELKLSADHANLILDKAKYIYISDLDRCCVISEIRWTNSGHIEMEIKGYMLERILNDRVIEYQYDYDGVLEAVIRDMITNFALSDVRRIASLKLGDIKFNNIVNGIITEGTTLEEALYSILTPLGLSYRIDLDFTEKSMIFHITDSEFAKICSFSTKFNTIEDVTFKRSDSDYKNFAYVSGIFTQIKHVSINTTSSVTERVPHKLTATADHTDGEPRREIFVTSDVNPSSDEMPMNTYMAMLQSYAHGILGNTVITEDLAISIVNDKMVYGKDYRVGSICSLEIEPLGIKKYSRIIKVRITYADGNITYEPFFGSQEFNIDTGDDI